MFGVRGALLFGHTNRLLQFGVREIWEGAGDPGAPSGLRARPALRWLSARALSCQRQASTYRMGTLLMTPITLFENPTIWPGVIRVYAQRLRSL